MHRFGEERRKRERERERERLGSCVAEIYGLAAYYGNFTVRCLFLRFGGAGLISLGIKIIIISRPSRKLPACLSFSRYDFGNGRLSSFHPQPPGGQTGHLLRLYCPLCETDEERQSRQSREERRHVCARAKAFLIEERTKFRQVIAISRSLGRISQREREGKGSKRRGVASRLVSSRRLASRHVTSRNVGRTAVEWNESCIRSPVCAARVRSR